MRRLSSARRRASTRALTLNWSVPIQLLAMDIDGTLLDQQGQLSTANADAISEAAARGIEIVLVTGRRFHFALPVAETLPCDFNLIVNNGALTKSRADLVRADLGYVQSQAELEVLIGRLPR